VGQAKSNWKSQSTPDTSGYITFLNCSAHDNANDGFDVKEGSHHVKFIGCSADWTKSIGNLPTGDPSVGNSGFYIRADYIQVINSLVHDLSGGNAAIEFGLITQDATTGLGPYGATGNQIRDFTALNIRGLAAGSQAAAIYCHTKRTLPQVFGTLTATDCDLGAYIGTVPLVIGNAADFVELTWDWHGGQKYTINPGGN